MRRLKCTSILWRRVPSTTTTATGPAPRPVPAPLTTPSVSVGAVQGESCCAAAAKERAATTSAEARWGTVADTGRHEAEGSRHSAGGRGESEKGTRERRLGRDSGRVLCCSSIVNLPTPRVVVCGRSSARVAVGAVQRWRKGSRESAKVEPASRGEPWPRAAAQCRAEKSRAVPRRISVRRGIASIQQRQRQRHSRLTGARPPSRAGASQRQRIDASI